MGRRCIKTSPRLGQAVVLLAEIFRPPLGLQSVLRDRRLSDKMTSTDQMGFHRPHKKLARIWHDKLVGRSRLVFVMFIPVVSLYSFTRALHIPSLHLVAVTLPYILAIAIAAALPKRLPAASSRYAAAILSFMVASDARYALHASRHEEPYTKLYWVRVLVPASFALAVACLVVDLLLTEGRRWWAGIRCVLTVCCSFRLGAILVLHRLGVRGQGFPPGRLSLATALWYNIFCLFIAIVVLSPSARYKLSEFVGLSRVVVNLEDVSHLSELQELRGRPWSADSEDASSVGANSRIRGHRRSQLKQLAPKVCVGLQADGRGGDAGGSVVSFSSGSSRSNRSGRSGSNRGHRTGRSAWGAVNANPASGGVSSLAIVPEGGIRKLRNARRRAAPRLTMYPEDFKAYFEKLKQEGQEAEAQGRN